MIKTYLILIAIYIVQILVVLAYPYYRYRKNVREERTIGNFMSYMNKDGMGPLKLCAFVPYFGVMALVLILILACVLISIEWLYNKFIKNIKI